MFWSIPQRALRTLQPRRPEQPNSPPRRPPIPLKTNNWHPLPQRLRSRVQRLIRLPTCPQENQNAMTAPKKGSHAAATPCPTKAFRMQSTTVVRCRNPFFKSKCAPESVADSPATQTVERRPSALSGPTHTKQRGGLFPQSESTNASKRAIFFARHFTAAKSN